MAWNKNAIASSRRAVGYSQPEFSKFAGISASAYSIHELNPEQFRVREFQNIANKLSRKNRLIFANAIIETIFGEGMEVKETD